MSYGGGGYGGGGYGGGSYGGGSYGGGSYGGGSTGSGYSPGVSTADLQQAGFQVASDGTTATSADGQVFIQAPAGSTLSDVPGVSTSNDAARAEAILNGAAQGTFMEALNRNTGTIDNVAISQGSTITQLGTHTFEVSNGDIAIVTSPGNGSASQSMVLSLTGNATAIVSQTGVDTAITVNVGAKK